MSGFREAYMADIPRRVFDLACHALLAWMLPGPWWLQFLPDAALPVLWVRAMVRDRRDSECSLLLRAHLLLHLEGRAPVVGLLLALGVAAHWPLAAAHWLSHVAVDTVTHDPGGRL